MMTAIRPEDTAHAPGDSAHLDEEVVEVGLLLTTGLAMRGTACTASSSCSTTNPVTPSLMTSGTEPRGGARIGMQGVGKN